MQTGLYDAGTHRDNCGFGLIAHLKGQPSHELLQTAIHSLTCMTHRGGIDADGKTGDGCGLLLKMPDQFMRDLAREHFQTPLHSPYAVGMVFLSQDSDEAGHERMTLTQNLEQEGLDVIGWREVPVDARVPGPTGQRSRPLIEQVFVQGGAHHSASLAASLFIARRRTEMALASHQAFYIPSLSAEVIAYKALVMPPDLPHFYHDLSDTRLQTAICVFHQRFSTNTLPSWSMAQPFRLLAHNGEINTISGNRNWADAHGMKFSTETLPDIHKLRPLVSMEGSDSASLDNMLEVLLTGGMNIYRALRMLVPPAWHNHETMDADLKAFYEYSSLHMAPWDGPAGMVLTDGRRAICMLDRNGLRPARYVVTDNDFITLSSEVGTHPYQPEQVVAKGRIGPGEMLSADIESGEILLTEQIEQQLKQAYPYKQWLREQAIRIESIFQDPEQSEGISADDLLVYQKMFQVSCEEREHMFTPVAESGQEAVGSMGDDTPVAVLSNQQRPLYDYFRQQFAQVTNPAIDPLREAIVMSLQTVLGRRENIFEQTPAHTRRVMLRSPVLSRVKYRKILELDQQSFPYTILPLRYDPAGQTLKEALEQLARQAEQAIHNGTVILVLSDRCLSRGELPIHALLATGAVHHHLMACGLRSDSNLIIETATARDSHHIAVLLGFGATAVYPYLGYAVLEEMVQKDAITVSTQQAAQNYRKGLNKGLLKILSKMGISTSASYCGAQLFEIVGLADEVVAQCFRGTPSRIQGATFADLERDQQHLAWRAFKPRKALPQGGLIKYVQQDGEYHCFNPEVVTTLQQAVQQGSYGLYQQYARLIHQRQPAALRDLLGLRQHRYISLDEVEPIEAILPRFDSAGMSLGALSPEAHHALAVAMNRLGARSNSGEGGEDSSRFNSESISKIKQIASGRFGVTPHYLVNAEVLQIKIAQGSKPGEGGQLPGGKVNPLIARLRYSVPGVTLISPPPHHDIYSIEDLAQLIFDLKQVNPRALVSVKLVSEPGIGTIATGVAKAYADLITVSGCDGGTAASPVTSIRYAGSPWELGLSETQQALRINGLRGKVRLQTDGGLKTGLDVIKAAIMGAESFGFGTAPMIALGCKYLRICHLNNCATGVATQNQTLRDNHFIGTVNMVMHFFQYVAHETREWLARLGFTRLEDIIGRTELLEQLPGETARQQHLDFSSLLDTSGIPEQAARFCHSKANPPFDRGELAEQIVAETLDAVKKRSGGEFYYNIRNCDRSIGARLSGEIAWRYGNLGMAETPITLHFQGVAGQSFGAWNAGGLHMTLEGDANDYVGKGMAGGRLVLRPPRSSPLDSTITPIMGNTCLYGATGGRLFASGTCGERFAIRNSGAIAVVEGAGDHCCEYMTGGVVTVLGPTGNNFGAGMTGGFAFVLDTQGTFVDQYNSELVEITRITQEAYETYRNYLRSLIVAFITHTGSPRGQEILMHFDDYISKFWMVKSKSATLEQLLCDMNETAA